MIGDIEREHWRPGGVCWATRLNDQEYIEPADHRALARELAEAYRTIRRFHSWHESQGTETIEGIELDMAAEYGDSSLYEDNAAVIARALVAPVFCKWCGDQTNNLETGECDRCWELARRINRDPKLAKKMLSDVWSPAEFKETEAVEEQPPVEEPPPAPPIEQPPSGERLLKIQEVSDLIGVSVELLYKLSQRGEIRAYKLGRQWRFSERDIAAYCAANLRG